MHLRHTPSLPSRYGYFPAGHAALPRPALPLEKVYRRIDEHRLAAARVARERADLFRRMTRSASAWCSTPAQAPRLPEKGTMLEPHCAPLRHIPHPSLHRRNALARFSAPLFNFNFPPGFSLPRGRAQAGSTPEPTPNGLMQPRIQARSRSLPCKVSIIHDHVLIGQRHTPSLPSRYGYFSGASVGESVSTN